MIMQYQSYKNVIALLYIYRKYFFMKYLIKLNIVNWK